MYLITHKNCVQNIMQTLNFRGYTKHRDSSPAIQISFSEQIQGENRANNLVILLRKFDFQSTKINYKPNGSPYIYYTLIR